MNAVRRWLNRQLSPRKYWLVSVVLLSSTVFIAKILGQSNIAIGPGVPVHLNFTGSTGTVFSVEAADTLAPAPNWKPALTVQLTNQAEVWCSPDAGLRASRFYRVRTLETLPVNAGYNFRLIDQQGVSHEVIYHLFDPTVSAIVVILTQNGWQDLQPFIPALTNLQADFQNKKVLFWIVESNPSISRSNLVQQAAAVGLNWPILQDSAQLVNRRYQVGQVPEVVALDTSTLNIFYQGAIEDAPGLVWQPYLRSALSSFLAGKPVSISWTQPKGHPPDMTPIPTASFSKDIAPLLQQKCVQCHSVGNIAPWAMTNYDIVAQKAPAMREVLIARHMPPWHADPENGVFSNDRSLSTPDLQKLVAWIDAGAPRGDGIDPLAANPVPPPPPWPAALGEPDAIVSIPIQDIPATGAVPYRYITVPTPFTSNVWLKAAVIRPSNRKVVHHANVSLGEPNRYMTIFVPGQDPVAFPGGTGRYLPAQTNLFFQMHYISDGQPETDQTELGLYLMPSKPALELQTFAAYATDISVPPGAREYQRQAEYVFSKDVLLYELCPHMHLRGSHMKFEAFYPDGTSETLLSVPNYSFSWQTLYRLQTPKRLPANTRIFISGAFDNSAQNLNNPDPTSWAYNGDQTWNEMFFGFLHAAEVAP